MALFHSFITCIHSLAEEIIFFAFKTEKENFLTQSLTIFLSINLIILGLFLLVPSLIFITFLKMYLLIQYKNQFGSFLFGMDTLLERLNITVSYVYLLENNKSYEERFQTVKNATQNLLNSNYKFSSTIQRCCGFYFYIKNNVNVNNIISTVDNNYSSKEEFINHLESNHFEGLNSKIKLWDVQIFKKAINWNGHNYYPVVITFNHCIGDGMRLTAFQNRYFLNNVTEEKFKNALVKSKRTNEVLKKSTIFKFLWNSYHMTSDYLASSKSCTQHLAVYIENEQKYLKLIPKLSRELQCTFTDIVVTTCTDSILDYLKLKNDVPNEITVGNSCREINENINSVWNLLRNDVAAECYTLSCKEENFYLKIMSWIQVVKEQRKTGNFQILYFMVNMFTLFPQVLSESFASLSTKKTALAFTNIPGPDSGKIGDIKVEKSFVFVNQFAGTKFGLTLFSFKGELHATLISDKQTNINRKDLQSILKNTFKKIDDLLGIKKNNNC